MIVECSKDVEEIFTKLAKKWNEKIIKAYLSNCNFAKSIELSSRILKDLYYCLKSFEVPIFIGFSGGKDSLVVSHLVQNVLKKMRLKRLFHVVFIEVNGNTHEKNVNYVNKCIDFFNLKRETQFIHIKYEKYDFWNLVSRWGFPGHRRRWCMTTFKRVPLRKSLSSGHSTPVMILGEKFADSPRRKNIYQDKGTFEYNNYWRQYSVHPILHWQRNYILKYIANKKLPINPLYEEIGASGNCVYCPYIKDLDYYKKLRDKYPEWFEKIINAENNMRNKGSALIVKSKKVWINRIQ